MCLRFVFLLITRMTSSLRLSRREEAWKIAEILILRHQLAVLQRRKPRRPNLDWADRALLATLLPVIPKARRQALRLLVTPDTVLRWHRDIVRRRWAARSKRGRTGRPATRRNIKALVLRLARENPRYVEPGIMWSRAMSPFWSWCLSRRRDQLSRPASDVSSRHREQPRGRLAAHPGITAPHPRRPEPITGDIATRRGAEMTIISRDTI